MFEWYVGRLRSAVATRERIIEADITDFKLPSGIATRTIDIDQLLDCYGSFCVKVNEYLSKMIAVNVPASDPVYLQISPDIEALRERPQSFTHTLSTFKKCLRILFCNWKLGHLELSLANYNLNKDKSCLLVLCSHITFLFHAKDVTESQAINAAEIMIVEDLLKELIVVAENLMFYEDEGQPILCQLQIAIDSYIQKIAR